MNKVAIVVPELPESVADATIITWNKKLNDSVKRDDVIVEVETDTVVLEVPALQEGYICEALAAEGEQVQARQIIGYLMPSDLSGKLYDQKPYDQKLHEQKPDDQKLHEQKLHEQKEGTTEDSDASHVLIPTAAIIAPTKATISDESLPKSEPSLREEKRVPLTPLRKRLAERLISAKQSTATLTTFNEVNMQPILAIKAKYAQQFAHQHDTKLGLTSFFIKACLEGLKSFPEINAYLDEEDVVYHNYFDISIAVATPRGLVTPVLRNVNLLSLADIEKGVRQLTEKAKSGRLSIDDLAGGNFTITNGGVFGSLLSTPLLNPPQTAILGMHAIKERPMAVDGNVVVLPMMYIALTYDHRLVDGQQAVEFLVKVKAMLEDPVRMLLDV